MPCLACGERSLKLRRARTRSRGEKQKQLSWPAGERANQLVPHRLNRRSTQRKLEKNNDVSTGHRRGIRARTRALSWVARSRLRPRRAITALFLSLQLRGTARRLSIFPKSWVCVFRRRQRHLRSAGG